MKKLNIKKGDAVRVVAGVSKGKEGVVLKVIPSTSRVIIEGDDIRKDSKHTKPNATNQDGGIVKQDAPIHISNVMLVDASTGKVDRVGRRQEDGKSVRYFKKSKELVK
ncbi:50S ribosomal protein L24 [Vicingaceae bacterium]|nr:50S ribosomal protein L24 [Vicingaceae bacterium]MDC1452156.1 50S ribosomal protein L24 [Vicingaceae bacterium]